LWKLQQVIWYNIVFAQCICSFCGHPWYIYAPHSVYVSLAFVLFAYLFRSTPCLCDSLRSVSFRSSELERPRGVDRIVSLRYCISYLVSGFRKCSIAFTCAPLSRALTSIFAYLHTAPPRPAPFLYATDSAPLALTHSHSKKRFTIYDDQSAFTYQFGIDNRT